MSFEILDFLFDSNDGIVSGKSQVSKVEKVDLWPGVTVDDDIFLCPESTVNEETFDDLFSDIFINPVGQSDQLCLKSGSVSTQLDHSYTQVSDKSNINIVKSDLWSTSFHLLNISNDNIDDNNKEPLTSVERNHEIDDHFSDLFEDIEEFTDRNVISVSEESDNTQMSCRSQQDIIGDLLMENANDEVKLRLSDEEKVLLLKEGFDLPTDSPLTHEEERILKSVRRKIRNKISAKESRKRKTDYIHGLEKRIKLSCSENTQLRNKVSELENQNISLKKSLQYFKSVLSKSFNSESHPSTCLMILALSCMLILLPLYNPFHDQSDSTIPLKTTFHLGHSRSLLQIDPQHEALSINREELQWNSAQRTLDTHSDLYWMRNESELMMNVSLY